MEIEFQGLYNKNTIFEAVKLANKPSKINTIVRIILVFVLIAILVISIVAISGLENKTILEKFISGLHLIAVPFLLFYLLMPYILPYLMAARIWKAPAMREHFRGIVSSQEIAYISPSETTGIDWAKFSKKQVTHNLIVLLTPDGVCCFLPRYFFKDDNDWNIVLQWVISKVVEAK